MEISFKSKKIERICTDFSEASRQHGKDMAEKIHQRIDELRAANSINVMIQFKLGRCHPLQGGRADQYALDLIHPQRLIFKSNGRGVKILEIINYH